MSRSPLTRFAGLSTGKRAGINQLLTIEKTGAYVEYLYEHGMIEITNPANWNRESRPLSEVEG